MRSLMQTLLYAVCAGEMSELCFSGSDRLRYAVYDQDHNRRIYVLNTDYDSSLGCELSLNNVSTQLQIPSCTLQVLSFDGAKFTQERSLAFSDSVSSQN